MNNLYKLWTYIYGFLFHVEGAIINKLLARHIIYKLFIGFFEQLDFVLQLVPTFEKSWLLWPCWHKYLNYFLGKINNNRFEVSQKLLLDHTQEIRLNFFSFLTAMPWLGIPGLRPSFSLVLKILPHQTYLSNSKFSFSFSRGKSQHPIQQPWGYVIYQRNCQQRR